MREGMKTGSSGAPLGTSYGPARQVVDGSYLLGVLRPKIAELTAEIERLRVEEDQIVKGEATLGQLQQRQNGLIADINSLKNTMADINFAVERANNQDAEQINNQAVALRQQNGDMRRTVDKIFLSVKEVDNQTKNLTQQLQNELQALEAKLLSQNQDITHYGQVRQEAYATSDRVLSELHEIRLLVCRKDLLLNSISQDADKKRAASTLLEILKKRQIRDEMRKETSISIEQERQNLLLQAKTTSADIDVLKRQLDEQKEAIQETNNRIAATTEELNEYSGDNMSKFNELQQKDREMQEFIDTYNEKEMEEIRKTQETEKVIIQLLERISRAHVLKQQMPQQSSKEVLEQLSAELNEKESQFKNAKVTHQRLEKEVEERREELSKINTLEEKISTELIAIANKIHERKQEISRCSDIDGLRLEIENRKKSLIARKGHLLKQRDVSKQRVHSLTTQYDTKRQSLNDNEIHSALASQEQRLRLLWQSTFSLEEFVRIKEKDTRFQGTKADCMRITDECNDILKNAKRFETQSVSILNN